MTEKETRKRVQESLHREVGGFFTNTARCVDTCAVCTGPATGELCAQCSSHREQYGDQLADQVVIFAYAKGNMGHQSGYHMIRYKSSVNPSEECRRDLKLMTLGGTLLHGPCIAASYGWWDTVTFVCSESRTGTNHPVVELAKQVVHHGRDVARILLSIGPDISGEPRRSPLTSRFAIDKRWLPDVRDRHILVIDDTWVSGDKSQSAALTLKAAGARAVTALCLARWLNPNYSEAHAQLIKNAKVPYDALLCPMTGGDCPTSAG